MLEPFFVTDLRNIFSTKTRLGFFLRLDFKTFRNMLHLLKNNKTTLLWGSLKEDFSDLFYL